MRFLIFIFMISVSIPGYSQTLKDILENFDTYHERTVEVTGEVIGESIKDPGGGYWLNILDEGINLGIFVSDPALIKKITFFGSYRVRGDKVRIIGTFYKRSPEHLERHISADSLFILEKGSARPDEVSIEKREAVIGLAGVCILLWIIHLFKLYYGRKNKTN
ncbi:MAG: hypothetical protein JXD21_08965 [Candidatus Omnitrophica bacterium]|nr:hypothetical protein [Candidatus Omnitrophota bacterium]